MKRTESPQHATFKKPHQPVRVEQVLSPANIEAARASVTWPLPRDCWIYFPVWGQIAIGLRADLAQARSRAGLPVVQHVWRQAKRVF
ncbi:hypothetical protein DL347_23300 [Pseudomonas fluorescens]|uniref:Uncharacterized protein n=1 Tax=Pseudomonas fluorescens TaxID=294 RepID=A0A7Z6QQI1_PSEFL|nr:hypothetical protein DL347_23300 [Pseudomonas fluorescens]